MTAKSINDDLSKELQVKPLEEGQIATFKLMRSGIFDPMTGKPATPNSHTIPGIELIFDKFSKRTIRIYNIKEYETIEEVGRPIVYKPKHEPVTFWAKPIVCNSDSNDLYFFLKRTSFNRDNPFRSRKYIPVFYEVDFERDARVAVDTTEYKRLALNIVADYEIEELLQLGRGLKDFDITIDLNQKDEILRRSFNLIAETNSEKLILASDDNRSKTRVYIDRAISEMLILFNPDTMSWIWTKAPDGGKVKKHIVKIEKGNNPKRALIDYLCDENKKGSDHRAELVTRTSKEETYQSPESKAVAPTQPDVVGNYVNKQKARVNEVAPLQGL